MVRNAERRTLLSDAAVRVLAQQGSRGLTHRAIDAEAKAPRGTASNYFASRDEIIDAILLRISERLQPDPDIHADLAQRPPSVELFTEYLRDIVHRLTDNRDAAIALFELRLEATRRPRVADHPPPARRGGAHHLAASRASSRYRVQREDGPTRSACGHHAFPLRPRRTAS